MPPRPSCSPCFPYTTLFRSVLPDRQRALSASVSARCLLSPTGDRKVCSEQTLRSPVGLSRDRKSTRLNSSHRCISYAVFCLKKKKQNQQSAVTTLRQPL